MLTKTTIKIKVKITILFITIMMAPVVLAGGDLGDPKLLTITDSYTQFATVSNLPDPLRPKSSACNVAK